MTGFDEILGHRPQIELLERMVATERVPHAMLFHGPRAVGKATIARLFASALLCEAGGESACGVCPSCLAHAAGSHTDLFRIKLQLKAKTTAAARAAFAAGEEPDPDDLSKEIVVDQIRELSHLASLSPRLGRRRVFLIDPAEAMNATAQNSLLKTLEEPPGRAVLLLIASRPHLLLPTVRSRSFALGFAPLQSAELARHIEERGVDPAEAALRAALAEGRPGRALELDLSELKDRREQLLSIVEQLVAGPEAIAELPAMSAALSGRHERTLVQGLDLLQCLLRDALRHETDRRGDALVHVDLAPRLSRLGTRLGADRAAELVRGVERCRNDLRFNVNRTYVAETLLAAVAGGPLP